MRGKMRNRGDKAFSRLDLTALVMAVAVLLGICVPQALAKSKVRASGFYCLSGLKQIALSLTLWAEQHERRFPMQVSWQEGGSKELSLRGWVAPTFWAASNELSNPKILMCPADKKRLPPPTSFASLTDRKMSYFLGYESSITNPASVVAGDRNVEINGVLVSPGLVSIKKPQTVSWNRTSLHEVGGNVALGDGSAHRVTSKQLGTSLEASSTANTLIVP